MIASIFVFGENKMDGMLSHLEELLEVKNVFERNRTPMRIRSLGILLYHFGLSLRKSSIIVSSFEDISYESIRKWYHRSKHLFYVESKHRNVIAIDETKVKIKGKLYILWAAIDIENWEIIGVWVTKGRASIEAYSFIKHVLRKCDNIPKILVDKGPWYIPALQRLGLDYEHVTFGLRNPIEQWFGLLKHRIKRFNRNWPNNADINIVQEWIDAFVSLYHVTRC